MNLQAEHIRNARLRAGMTQKDLAKLLKVTPQFICNLENGRASFPPAKLKKLAAFLNTEVLIRAMVQDYERKIRSCL